MHPRPEWPKDGLAPSRGTGLDLLASWPATGRFEIDVARHVSLDLMRRRADPDLPNGVTDFVVISTIEHVKNQQHWGVGLNFAVMRSVVAGELNGGFHERERRVLHKPGPRLPGRMMRSSPASPSGEQRSHWPAWPSLLTP